MKMKRYIWSGVLVVCVLALLAWTAWYNSQPRWQAMPESLTTPPDVDRSQIPLGPYTVDFSGLIGGSTGEGIVTFYVVLQPGDVHFQRVREVGRKLDTEGALAVTALSVSLTRPYLPAASIDRNGVLVDGLFLLDGPYESRPHFLIPLTEDASGRPIRIICSLYPKGLQALDETHSFQRIESGFCNARFYPRQVLSSFIGGVPPEMMPKMASFLPDLFKQVSDRIHGEP